MINKNILFSIFSDSPKKLAVSVIPRENIKQTLKFLNYKEILAITGVRRCGKTYLMYSLMQHLIKKKVPQENILYLNFEDERLAFIQPEDLDKIHQWFLEYSEVKGKLYFFLDEIQNVPLWEKWLSRNYEKIKFIISGSNATLLSSELATAITGRYVELSVYPFSFKEYLSFKDKSLLDKKKQFIIENKVLIVKHFKKYLELGGFPEVLLHNKKDLLPHYYQTILLKDIISRYNIKHKDYVEKLSLFLMSNLGTPTSYYSLDKLYPIGINTIRNYLNFIEKCFLLFFLNKHDYSLKKQQANPKKVYVIDIALAKSVSFNFSSDFGRIFENLVFIELKRKKSDLFYYKGKKECDFLIQEGLKIKQAIQVCHELNKNNKEREVAGLLEAMEKHNLKEGLIINTDIFDEERISGKKITYLPLWMWLLA